MKSLILSIVLLSGFCFADTPPQVINITCASNQFLNSIVPGSAPTCGVPANNAVWGSITGTISNQMDLYSILTETTNSYLTTIPNLLLPYSQLTGTVPIWNQNTTGTAANITASSNNSLTSLPSLILPTSQLSGTINLATQVSGNLSPSHLNSGTGASNNTYWRGDGTWATPTSGGTPGGSNTDVQYNNGGVFGGNSGLTYDGSGSLTASQNISAGGVGSFYNGAIQLGSTSSFDNDSIFTDGVGDFYASSMSLYGNGYQAPLNLGGAWSVYYNQSNGIFGILDQNSDAVPFVINASDQVSVVGQFGLETSTPVSDFNLQDTPQATPNYGMFSMGNGFWDGASAPFFNGNANGTYLGINDNGTLTGNFLDFQFNGTSQFNIAANGATTFNNIYTLETQGNEYFEIYDIINGINDFTIDNGTGYVGIGPDYYPSYPLDVQGTINTQTGVNFNNSGTNQNVLITPPTSLVGFGANYSFSLPSSPPQVGSVLLINQSLGFNYQSKWANPDNFFIDQYYVSTNGSNATGDGSLLNPWASIDYAESQIAGYTGSNIITINVASGVYDISNVTLEPNVIISGEGQNQTTLTWDSAANPFVVPFDQSAFNFYPTAPSWGFSNCTLGDATNGLTFDMSWYQSEGSFSPNILFNFVTFVNSKSGTYTFGGVNQGLPVYGIPNITVNNSNFNSFNFIEDLQATFNYSTLQPSATVTNSGTSTTITANYCNMPGFSISSENPDANLTIFTQATSVNYENTLNIDGTTATYISDFYGFTTDETGFNLTGGATFVNNVVWQRTGFGVGYRPVNFSAWPLNPLTISGADTGAIDQMQAGQMIFFGLNNAGHYISNGLVYGDVTIAPTSNAGSGSGAGCNTSACNDQSGQLYIQTGTGNTSGDQVNVTFQTAYNVAPTVMLTPANSNSGANLVGYYVISTTTGFSIYFKTAGVVSTNYLFNYMIQESD